MLVGEVSELLGGHEVVELEVHHHPGRRPRHHGRLQPLQLLPPQLVFRRRPLLPLHLVPLPLPLLLIFPLLLLLGHCPLVPHQLPQLVLRHGHLLLLALLIHTFLPASFHNDRLCNVTLPCLSSSTPSSWPASITTVSAMSPCPASPPPPPSMPPPSRLQYFEPSISAPGLVRPLPSSGGRAAGWHPLPGPQHLWLPAARAR